MSYPNTVVWKGSTLSLYHLHLRFESFALPVDGEIREMHLSHVQVVLIWRFIEIGAESGQSIRVQIHRQRMDVSHQHVDLAEIFTFNKFQQETRGCPTRFKLHPSFIILGKCLCICLSFRPSCPTCSHRSAKVCSKSSAPLTSPNPKPEWRLCGKPHRICPFMTARQSQIQLRRFLESISWRSHIRRSHLEKENPVAPSSGTGLCDESQQMILFALTEGTGSGTRIETFLHHKIREKTLASSGASSSSSEVSPEVPRNS